MFLTLAQSKLHSYILFLFVPLALLAGQTLDALLATGYRSTREQWVVRSLGIVQVAVAVIGFQARGLTAPAIATGLFLLALLVLQWRQWWTAWAWGNVLAVAAAVVVAIDWGGSQIEAITSVKPLTARLLAEGTEGEPIICGRSLARGVFFYTQQPVMVYANRAQPFYSPHALPVIVGKPALVRFLQTRDSVPAVFTTAEWDRLRAGTGNGGRRQPPFVRS